MMADYNVLVASETAEAGMVFSLETTQTERLVNDINRVWNRSAVSTLVAVGELIVGACYAGDIARGETASPTVV